MNTTLDVQDIVVTGLTDSVKAPAWFSCHKPTVVGPSRLASVPRPDVAFVRAERPQRLLAHVALLRAVNAMLSDDKRPSVVVLAFDGKSGDVTPVFEHFSDPFRVEVAWGVEQAKSQFLEAVAKVSAAKRKMPRPDLLGEIKAIIDATADLRAESGRLDAAKIAKVFGIREVELADALGVTKQALSKTPDSKRIQEMLRHFDRTARLRAVFRDDKKFRSWLRMPRASLDDAQPIDLLLGGEANIVGDLAEDMITGAPS